VTDTVRIDKWLWAARFYKTRSLATDAVAGGHVRIDDVRVKASREVRIGETVEISQGPWRRTVVVKGLGERRGSASIAATLYEETEESATTRQELAEQRRLTQPVFDTRPTKQDRRRLDAMRKGQRRR
jgi:ribosome-associated heat shock protein Hsp15